jgi:hypothetical protein
MFGVKPQQLMLQIMLALVIAFHPIQRKIKKPQHKSAYQQAQESHQGDGAPKGFLQTGNVAHHHHVADTLAVGINQWQHGQMQRLSAFREHLCLPHAQGGQNGIIHGNRYICLGIRHHDLLAKPIPIPLSFEQCQTVLPLLRWQQLFVHQHQQVDRQTVMDFLHQIDQFRIIEIQVRDPVLGTQGLKQRTGFAQQGVAVLGGKRGTNRRNALHGMHHSTHQTGVLVQFLIHQLGHGCDPPRQGPITHLHLQKISRCDKSRQNEGQNHRKWPHQRGLDATRRGNSHIGFHL